MEAIGSLKNGLTHAQVTKAKEILAQVSLRKVCRSKGISLMVVTNVLRDQSGRVDILKIALDGAMEAIEARKELLASIPGE